MGSDEKQKEEVDANLKVLVGVIVGVVVCAVYLSLATTYCFDC